MLPTCCGKYERNSKMLVNKKMYLARNTVLFTNTFVENVGQHLLVNIGMNQALGRSSGTKKKGH
jgi:hypothetical protein